jgi:hypothetical protein
MASAVRRGHGGATGMRPRWRCGPQCRSDARRRIGRHARVLGRRGTFDRLSVRRAFSLKQVQATFELLALLFNEALDELFAPAPLALGPLAQVAIPASLTCGVAVVVGRAARRGHLQVTVMSPCPEFIGKDRATCSVLLDDLFARWTTQAAARLGSRRGYGAGRNVWRAAMTCPNVPKFLPAKQKIGARWRGTGVAARSVRSFSHTGEIGRHHARYPMMPPAFKRPFGAP